jgi:hypothetical protein
MSQQDLFDSDVMELKDTDKYVRQIGSKALLPTSRSEALEYEQKRRLLLGQQQRLNDLETKLNSMEAKVDKLLNMMERQLNTNAD